MWTSLTPAEIDEVRRAIRAGRKAWQAGSKGPPPGILDPDSTLVRAKYWGWTYGYVRERGDDFLDNSMRKFFRDAESA